MRVVHQRSVGIGWLVPATVVLFVVDVILVIPHIPGRYSPGRFVAMAVTLFPMLAFGVVPLILWWGLDLRVDEAGLHFGTRRRPRQPRKYGAAIRNPWLAPWDAVSNVRLVRTRSAVRAMRRQAGGSEQLALYLAYFPRSGRPALAFDVDLDQVEIHPLVPNRPGVRSTRPRPTPHWAFPVRRVAPVLEALRERGIEVAEVDEPVFPTDAGVATDAARTASAPGRADEQFRAELREALTQNLGRPPTDAELDHAAHGSWEDDDGSAR